MLFTLEALQAHEGDSLLLHYGDPGDPRLVLIDGGPRNTWPGSRARLDALREARAGAGAKLPIRLVMVSHIDDDHIQGILDLTDALLDGPDRPEYEITWFWHNSFDDVVGPAARTSIASIPALQGASAEALPGRLPVERQAELVLQSVAQGRRLRNNVAKLGLEGNLPFEGLVTVDHPANPVDLDDGLVLTVIGPARAEIDRLEQDWDRHLRAKQAAGAQGMEAIAAEFVDNTVYNLSSLVVLAEAGGKRMLLTGDARGDRVIQGLEARGVLEPGGKLEVDVLKLPHHGSIRNVARTFFERIVARNYVISANGENGNPDLETLRLLTEVRGNDAYAIHLTNRVPAAAGFLEQDRLQRRYTVVYREDPQPSVKIDLGEPLRD